MTTSQIRWAALHDWFVRSNGNGSITVNEVSHHDATGWTEELLTFSDFEALRAWAGY